MEARNPISPQRPCTRHGDRHFIYIMSLIFHHGPVEQPQKGTQSLIHPFIQQIFSWTPMMCSALFWQLPNKAAYRVPQAEAEPTEPLGCDRSWFGCGSDKKKREEEREMHHVSFGRNQRFLFFKTQPQQCFPCIQVVAAAWGPRGRNAGPGLPEAFKECCAIGFT